MPQVLRSTPLLLCLALAFGSAAAQASSPQGEWIALFDGRSLDGWRASENPGTFSVRDGLIVADGKRSHLFYVGPASDATFKNFELVVEVRTQPRANSGVYFHTAYQESGWPDKGYEIQINNTQSDWRRTGSLYGVVDLAESSATDNEWFTIRLRVEGQRIQAWVNDRQTVDYVEPPDAKREAQFAGRRLGRGTIALQGHDPDSIVHFRQVRIRLLP